MTVSVNLIAFVGALVAFGALLAIVVFCLTKIKNILQEIQICLDSIVILLAKQSGMSIMMDGSEVEDVSSLLFGEGEQQKEDKE